MKRFAPSPVVVAGLLGFVVAFVLPSSWLYVAPKKTARETAGVQYACPMACVIMDALPADEKCPVCGMELAPVSTRETLDEHEQFMVGLQGAKLRRGPLVKELELLGEVAFDESRLFEVTARSMGWVESLPVSTTWQPVSAGEVLFELYSPDVYQAQEELLVAHRSSEAELVASARQRLRLLGVGDRDIEDVEKDGRARRRIPFRSPRDGVVIRRHVAEGASVKAGASVLTIADLAKVWIELEVFEVDLAWLQVGTSVELSAETSDRRFEAEVVFIDPTVDRRSRVSHVRLEIDNEFETTSGTWRFLPGERIDASARVALQSMDLGLETSSDGVLAVPRAAVLRTGSRDVVYVLYEDRGAAGRHYEIDPANPPKMVGFELVEVELGPLARRGDVEAREEVYPVRRVRPGTGGDAIRELRAGMVIATNGTLLLDSQAQLSGRPSSLFPSGRMSMPSGDTHAGH